METAEKPRRGRPSEGARDAVVKAARKLFMQRDFERVSTEEILERAGVSRGALYHHFPGKLEVYEAVWVDAERRLIRKLAAAAADAGTPYETLLAGCLAYLDEAATNREMQRIGLLQSRTVLGWERWRDGVRELGLGTIREAVRAAMESGELRRADPEATAHLVLAALIEAGLLIATAEDRASARREAEPVFTGMLEGLRR